jgi:hypothetical protein
MVTSRSLDGQSVGDTGGLRRILNISSCAPSDTGWIPIGVTRLPKSTAPVSSTKLVLTKFSQPGTVQAREIRSLQLDAKMRALPRGRSLLGLACCFCSVYFRGCGGTDRRCRIRPSNPRHKTDVENARLSGSFVRHGLAAWRYAAEEWIDVFRFEVHIL